MQLFKKKQEFSTGLKFEMPNDPRDVYTSQYAAEFGAFNPDLAYYGTEEKIIRKLKVEDQGSHGSCVGQTFSKIKEITEKKRLSARYVYVLTDKYYENSNGGGLFPRNAAKMMHEIGAVADKHCPDENRLNDEDYYDVEKVPGVEHYKNDGYAFVPRNNIVELKKAFHEHGALCLAVSKGKFNKRTGQLTSGGSANHAVMAYGVEKMEDGRHKVYFLNSWGKFWGDNGRGYFIFEDLVADRTLFYFMATAGVPYPVIQENKKKYPTIRRGSVGETVKVAQKILGITADGIFGPQTKRYVVWFQIRNRLSADGIVGKNTWAKLLAQN